MQHTLASQETEVALYQNKAEQELKVSHTPLSLLSLLTYPTQRLTPSHPHILTCTLCTSYTLKVAKQQEASASFAVRQASAKMFEAKVAMTWHLMLMMIPC